MLPPADAVGSTLAAGCLDVGSLVAAGRLDVEPPVDVGSGLLKPELPEEPPEEPVAGWSNELVLPVEPLLSVEPVAGSPAPVEPVLPLLSCEPPPPKPPKALSFLLAGWISLPPACEIKGISLCARLCHPAARWSGRLPFLSKDLEKVLW